MSIELRQDSISGAYDIRICGRKYQNLRKKIHKAGKRVGRSNGKDREEMERLNRIRARLIETQHQLERYVRIAPQDIPPGAHIRPGAGGHAGAAGHVPGGASPAGGARGGRGPDPVIAPAEPEPEPDVPPEPQPPAPALKPVSAAQPKEGGVQNWRETEMSETAEALAELAPDRSALAALGISAGALFAGSGIAYAAVFYANIRTKKPPRTGRRK